MKNAVELIESLRYKLRMFGVPIEGPTNIFCNNEAVYKNTSLPESVLKKKHHSIAYHWCREAVAAGTVRVAKEGHEDEPQRSVYEAVITAPARRIVRQVYLLMVVSSWRFEQYHLEGTEESAPYRDCTVL